MARYLLLVIALIFVVLGFWFRHVSEGGLGEHEQPGVVTTQVRPAEVVARTEQAVADAADEMLVSRPKQILWPGIAVTILPESGPLSTVKWMEGVNITAWAAPGNHFPG